MTSFSGEDLIKKIQEKMAEQNEVIREQQIQIQEQLARIAELEQKLSDMGSADAERNEMLSKLAELVD